MDCSVQIGAKSKIVWKKRSLDPFCPKVKHNFRVDSIDLSIYCAEGPNVSFAEINRLLNISKAIPV
jgi:hypothetical protein